MGFLSSLLLLWGFHTAAALHRSSPVERGLNSINPNTSLYLPPPSEDPWFQPPTGWKSTSTGTALKVRASAYNPDVIDVGNCIDTFQVLYRTTDTHTNASWAVTTVFIPASHAQCNNGTNPENCSHGIVSYEVPYDSADPDAAPSYLLQFGEPYGEIYDLLNRGWFVNVPDYEGPLSSYCAGMQSGHATLDSLKAVLQVAGQFGLRMSDAKAALWGYSGGAMATEFAAELASSYAPDLKLAGVVHGGLVPNVMDGEQRMNGKDAAGLIMAGILGITSQHPEARKYIDSRLKESGPYNKTRFYSALGMNGVQVLLAFENESVYDYFQNGRADLENPILTDMYNKDALMGIHGTPNMPVFIYKAVQDQMSPANATDALVDAFCKDGANILYHRNNMGGHNSELWQGRARALAFLSTVIDGTNELPMPKTGCKIENVTVAVTVTLNWTLVMEGSQRVNYEAITVNHVNATVLANGSVLWPEGNSSVLINPVPNKRDEGLGFMEFVGTLGRKKVDGEVLRDVGRRLDVLAPQEWWFSTRVPFNTAGGG
jgi:hypothetical protein